MTGKKMTGIESLWSTIDSGIDQPMPVSKEVMEQHSRLVREYTSAVYMMGRSRRVPKAVKDAEEVARANLRAFERLHGLTSSDPRIG